MTRWTEAAVIYELARWAEWWRRLAAPNIYIGGNGHEADFALLTQSNILWEFEVKVSRSDWKADNSKGKQLDNTYPAARFYYAVPECLLDKELHSSQKLVERIPDWVNPSAGVLLFGEKTIKSPDGRAYDFKAPTYPRCIRQSKVLHKRKADPGIQLKMYKSIYNKYWRNIAPDEAKANPNWLELEDA